MNVISFMSANYVARQVGYNMTEGWAQGDRATNEHFRPLDTFGQRFDQILSDVRALGFEAIDIWVAHLNWAWATDEHIAIAQDLLAKHQLQVVSLAGGFGAERREFEAACRLARSLGTDILGGNAPLLQRDRATLVEVLRDQGVRFGLENHPDEKTSQDLLDKLGPGDEDVMGVTVDTGWFGTLGYDAVRALRELSDRLFHVHLKDVLAPGAHETCRYGQGCVPIEACVRTLQELGYTGAISVEHEPEHFDPSEDCRANLEMLKRWWA